MVIEDMIQIEHDLRTINIPSNIKLLGVESDDDVNRLWFAMPRTYCEYDLSTFGIRINYMNANNEGDVYVVDDMTVDTDNIVFTWLVGRHACEYKGNVKFIVCLKKVDGNGNVVQEYNTTIKTLPVLEGLETSEAVIQENPDIFEQLLLQINTALDGVSDDVSDWLDDHISSGYVVDDTLTVRGAAADAKTVGDTIASIGGLSNSIKEALLQIAQKVAYIDANGQNYYDDLYDALYAITAIILSNYSLSFSTLNSTQQLTATLVPSDSSAAVTWESSDTSVATVDSTGLVTSVGYGNATITATAGSVSATCSILVAQATVESISAVLNAGNHTFYVGDDINDIKDYLTVTAHYSDNTSATIPSSNYTLSGELSNTGANTITVSYGGQTTTVSVTAVGLSSISAVYTQSGTVYDTDSLDDLKSDLVVTAHYSDSSTSTVDAEDYTLSGTLVEGTSTITVAYGGKTTTFTVTVSVVTAYDYTPTNIQRGATFDSTTGEVISASQYSAIDTDYIPVNANTVIVYTNAPTAVNWIVAMYDSSKNYLGQIKANPSPAVNVNALGFTLENASFIRIYWYKGNDASFTATFRIYQGYQTTPVEIGDINATTGEDSTEPKRARTVDYLPASGTVSVFGCPFSDSWYSWCATDYGYGVRCYDSSKAFIANLDLGGLSRKDIKNVTLPTGTAYVRMIFQKTHSNFPTLSSEIKHAFVVGDAAYLLEVAES